MAPASDGGSRAFPLRYGKDVHDAVLRNAQAEMRNGAAQIHVLVRDALRARAAGRRSPPPGAPSEVRHATTLRWSDAFRAEVQASADADGRSLNVQVEVLLREALAARGIRVGTARDAVEGKGSNDG